jgi:pyruvate,water dikinase
VDASSEASLQEASTTIRELFDTVEIPADLKEQILHPTRPCSRQEDGAGRRALERHRGGPSDRQLRRAQDTYLNVESPEELLDKVRKCWSSLYTPRAIYYRVTKGFEHSK